VGVTEVVLAINYQPEVMMEALDEIAAAVGVKITCSQEKEPMGTAGPLALAREHLDDGEPFFVFNSDVTCTYPLRELLEFHTSHKGEGTIFVTKVSEPSKYGVVVHEDDGTIRHFVEKPQTFVGNHINPGLYIFNPSILDRIPLKPTSIEKEIFPKMAEEGTLFAMVLPGFWMDIGQPPDYLTGMALYLASREAVSDPALAPVGPTIRGPVLIVSQILRRSIRSLLCCSCVCVTATQRPTALVCRCAGSHCRGCGHCRHRAERGHRSRVPRGRGGPRGGQCHLRRHGHRGALPRGRLHRGLGMHRGRMGESRQCINHTAGCSCFAFAVNGFLVSPVC
jgi:dTDP-glucose pyrophosphorylase